MAVQNPHGKYSDPVPLIGLYIAGASVLCSLLMLYDIIHGFIKMQRWLPCKLFKLNSLTLSLIAVVVKLPVDLTTPMPSELDQFSKIAGTMSLCVYMCYIFPSLGDMKDRTNMYALNLLFPWITLFPLSNTFIKRWVMMMSDVKYYVSKSLSCCEHTPR
ncbi:hypothetical protein ACHQM5_011739 [Ranunculus cassubicifolius]